MASIHGDGVGFACFLLMYTKCSGQEFLDSQAWFFFIFVDVCVFAALTSSTRLAC
jgi:hypothetical protein